MKDSAQTAYKTIVTQQSTLEEGALKNAMLAVGAAGAIAGATYIGTKTDTEPTRQQVTGQIQNALQSKFTPEYLTSKVTEKFKVDPDKAASIVHAAMKYSHPVFPQPHHILAIAGIESSFDDKAVSKLRHDPAVGLMQVRPKVWNIHPSEFNTIEGQIKHGAHILHHYYKKTGSVDSAVKAYNIGLTNYNKGKQRDAASRYHSKFQDEISRY